MKQYIPELDYHFDQYWSTRGEIRINNVFLPEVETEENNIPTGSFIELLFSQAFVYDDYKYRFEEIAYTLFTKPIRERLQNSSTLINCYISTDSTSETNLFSLETTDLILLDKLKDYRQDVEGLNLDDVIYDDLTTALSKLIYIYLDIMLHNSYERFNTIDTLSTEDNLLCNLFETYVVNEAYKAMKNWSFLIDANLLELRLVHDAVVLNEEQIENEQAPMSTSTYDLDIWVWWNGRKLTYEEEYDLYRIWDGQDGRFYTRVGWHDKGLDIKLGHTITMEYYVVVQPLDAEKDPFVDGEEYSEIMTWLLDGGLF